MTFRNSRLYRRACRYLPSAPRVAARATSVGPVTCVDLVAPESGRVADGWSSYRPELVQSDVVDAQLTMRCVRECAWYLNWRGPMLHRPVSGDGTVRVSVITRSASDTRRPPNAEWQFGGIILRDPAADGWLSNESYVFNAVGHRHDRLAIEIKSTRHGYSDVSAIDWPTGAAELSLERQGTRFQMRARPLEGASWTEIGEYDRPDLPRTLQLGVMLYAYSEGRGIVDLDVAFDGLDARFDGRA